MAKGDDVQANVWKLLNNANFRFDCGGNSQNKSLHLIYDEDEEVEFISKYGDYNSDNCFLKLDSRIENINRYYDNVENLDEEEKPYAETLREEEMERWRTNFPSIKKR